MNQPTPFQKWFESSSRIAEDCMVHDSMSAKYVSEQAWNAALDAAAKECSLVDHYNNPSEYYSSLVRSLKSDPISASSEHAKPALADRYGDGPGMARMEKEKQKMSTEPAPERDM